LASSRGSGFVGDCSGGRFEDGWCVNTQPAVDWTAARAAEAVDHFIYAPMVRGRLSAAPRAASWPVARRTRQPLSARHSSPFRT
jgi:hypothetical protein